MIVLNGPDARQIYENAISERAMLVSERGEKKQRVPLIWKRLDRAGAKIAGKWSPDQALIEEIDAKPHTVMFTDEMAYLKAEMIADDENPYQKVYFVDVEVSRIEGKVVSYRVTGFHGKEDLET